MMVFLRLLLAGGAALTAIVVGIAAVFVGGYFYVAPGLPQAHELRNVRFQIPLRIYSRDGRLMEQFGEQKRSPVAIEDVPPLLVQAILAAEDDTFFEHPGFDYGGTGRAAFNFLVTGGSMDIPGGSTLTQQIARDFFLSRDVTLVRKFKELILAMRIEQEFTKEEILELFLNTTFFGQQSFGVAAAAQTYFNKELDDLTLSDVAIIAGIPQGPSIMNPYYSPERASLRRSYVLGRLRELGTITPTQEREALAVPIVSRRYGLVRQLDAPYVAEMVRIEMLRRFGPAALTAGLKVTTTIDSRLQVAANDSVRATLVDYDERHGYRGPIAQIDLTPLFTDAAGAGDGSSPSPAAAGLDAVDPQRLRELLADYGNELDLETAIVVDVEDSQARVFTSALGFVEVGLDAVRWARRFVNDSARGPVPSNVGDVLAAGDIVRFRTLPDGSLRLAQLPDVQGAFVALDPRDGAVVSLVGGFDYFLSNYNRATQPGRQPGSAFKPFIYSAALEHGFTPASIINDAYVTVEGAGLERLWRPENYTSVSHGEVRLREALSESMNLAAIRTLRDVGIGNAIRHARKFGFDDRALPNDLTLALGSGGVSPINLAKGYAVFANGGHGVDPYFIERIEDANGDVLYPMHPAGPVVVCVPIRGVADAEEGCGRVEEPEAKPAFGALREPPPLAATIPELYPDIRRAERVVAPQNVYLITDILKDVIRTGSGARAGRALARGDLAGKTGTTNEARDAWFAGFNADIVATAWVGFDADDRPLGRSEQGGVTAIPMWIGFMTEALEGRPERSLEPPPGIVEARINKDTGLLASDVNPNGILEKFRDGHLPPRESDAPYRRFDDGVLPPRSGAAEPIF